MAITREKIVEQPRATAVSGLAKQLWQLSDVRRNPPRLGRMYGVAALRRPAQRERLYLVPLRLAKILSDGRPLIQRAFIFSSL